MSLLKLDSSWSYAVSGDGSDPRQSHSLHRRASFGTQLTLRNLIRDIHAVNDRRHPSQPCPSSRDDAHILCRVLRLLALTVLDVVQVGDRLAEGCRSGRGRVLEDGVGPECGDVDVGRPFAATGDWARLGGALAEVCPFVGSRGRETVLLGPAEGRMGGQLGVLAAVANRRRMTMRPTSR